MSKKGIPLSATLAKQAKPKDKEYSLPDSDGLALRIKPNGSKLWVFNYQKPHSTKRSNLGLGQYPTVSLATARKLRDDARALLAQDINPKEHRDEVASKQKTIHSNTFKFVADQWIEIKKTSVSHDQGIDIYRSLENHIFPRLGSMPIHKVKANLAIETLTPIATAGSLDTVKRIAQRLNEVMNYAVNTGVLEVNPLTGITKAFQAPKKKHYATLRPDELPELLATLKIANIQYSTRILILWQLHTMVRPSEAAGTHWDEIDIENKTWTIPAERMKKSRSHTIPLSPQALSLLEEIKPLTGHREFVFYSGRTTSGHSNESTVNVALKRHGFKGRLVAHGLRSLASTTLNEQGFDADIIESALAHVDQNHARAAYNRAEYLKRRRAMMEWWSDHIENS